MKKRCLATMLLGLLLGCTGHPPDPDPPASSAYLKAWQSFSTILIKQEKSFQSYESFTPQSGNIVTVGYPSDSFMLKGLLNTQHIDSLQRKPAIVYLHGGFALSYKEMERTQPFTDAGYIVFAPSYRGENGNPGFFELFMGEVRDARAAILWLAEQPFIDPGQLYLFGWSVGGGIALNLALHPDMPIRLGSSSAGIYDKDLIKSWATEDEMIVFPYDYTDSSENYFRLPLYHLQDMVRPHVAYIGKDDDYAYYQALKDSLYPDDPTQLALIPLEGNHVSSLKPAMERFLQEIQNNAKGYPR